MIIFTSNLSSLRPIHKIFFFRIALFYYQIEVENYVAKRTVESINAAVVRATRDRSAVYIGLPKFRHIYQWRRGIFLSYMLSIFFTRTI